MNSGPLAKYKSHKIVEAGQIEQIEQHPDGSATLSLNVLGYLDTIDWDVDAPWMRRHAPKVGGYLVRYADGYESWSPKEAFEEGYSPLPLSGETHFEITTDRETWRIDGKKYEVNPSGMLTIFDAQNEVASFAPGCWHAIKKLP